MLTMDTNTHTHTHTHTHTFLMGKAVQQQQHNSNNYNLASPNDQDRSSYRCRICEIVRFRCVLVLLLGVSVMLSGLFLLPPFLKNLDGGDLDLNFKSYEIVATFTLGKPVSLLEDNINKLEDDIFIEIEAPTVKVEILSLIPTPGSNITKVVFAIVPYDKSSKISETGLSLIRANFVSLIVRQYTLRLTFGNAFSFEVLKFAGGITVIPPQSAFLLQKVQILFNFTLNSSINQTLENFNVLKSQLKRGLRLASYENLYIKLTNPKGSTVAIPTTLQTTVVLAVGNTPSQERLKQLAKTITHSHVRNLGLNNTVFGRVKQVRLSSILQHSLTSPAPAPSPMPHHHHHHHHHHTGSHISPVSSPAYKLHIPKILKKGSPVLAPVPSRMRDHTADPPGCPFGRKGRNKKGYKNYHFFPPVEPPVRELAPSPSQRINPPLPTFPPSHAFSPLSHHVNGPILPPVQSEPDISPREMVPSIAPSPSQSSAGSLLLSPLWAIPNILVLALLL